jgi:hypothetical protein
MQQLTHAEVFAQRGFVRVEQAFSREDARTMTELLWDALGRNFGIFRSEPSTWDRPFRKAPLNEIAHTPVFWNIFADRLAGVIDVLLDGAWNLPEVLGDLLITFPNASAWELPHDGWHSDEGYVPGLMGFIFLNDVEREGGGTLIVQGSHRLPRLDYRRLAEPDGAGRKWKHRWEAERQSEWLRALRTHGDPAVRYQRFVETATDVDGIPLQVVELTGKAGDAVLCHPWLMHAIASNASATPRFMRTPRIRGVEPSSSSSTTAG